MDAGEILYITLNALHSFSYLKLNIKRLV